MDLIFFVIESKHVNGWGPGERERKREWEETNLKWFFSFGILEDKVPT